jgi:hypothetical protein
MCIDLHNKSAKDPVGCQLIRNLFHNGIADKGFERVLHGGLQLHQGSRSLNAIVKGQKATPALNNLTTTKHIETNINKQ